MENELMSKVAVFNQEHRGHIEAGHISVDDCFTINDKGDRGLPVFLRSDGELEVVGEENGEPEEQDVVDALNRGCALVGALVIEDSGASGKYETFDIELNGTLRSGAYVIQFVPSGKAIEVFGETWLTNEFHEHFQKRVNQGKDRFYLQLPQD